MGSRDQYRFVGQRLAERGILAIVADYRTYPATTFPGFVEDGARAVAWARLHAAEHAGDPERLFVAGHSAGAQIAALIATDPRYLAAEQMRPSDLAGVIGLSGPYDFVISGGYRPVFGPLPSGRRHRRSITSTATSRPSCWSTEPPTGWSRPRTARSLPTN